jgi:hypothetical protein
VVLRAAPDAPGAPAGEHGHMAVSTPRPVAPPDASSLGLLALDIRPGDRVAVLELTPTLKVKRRIAYERYRDNLEALYEP